MSKLNPDLDLWALEEKPTDSAMAGGWVASKPTHLSLPGDVRTWPADTGHGYVDEFSSVDLLHLFLIWPWVSFCYFMDLSAISHN